MNAAAISIDQLFHPIEHAILCDWLGKERPDSSAEIDLEALVDGPDDGPVTLKHSCDGTLNEFTLRNAVARLLLGGIQQRLPTSAVCYSDRIVLTRDYTPRGRRKLDLLPRFLFQINWANSGPGISWPVAYYVIWLPVYDIFVVTGSADSPEAFGYCDYALGWFDADIPLEEGVRRVIVGDWQHQRNEWDQEQWENFWDEGLISTETVWSWAAEVWGTEEEEDDEVEADFL